MKLSSLSPKKVAIDKQVPINYNFFWQTEKKSFYKNSSTILLRIPNEKQIWEKYCAVKSNRSHARELSPSLIQTY